MSDKIVRVKKDDLERLIKANVDAYNLLDEIDTQATNVEEGIKKAFRSLEDAPSELDEIVVEEEDDDKDEED